MNNSEAKFYLSPTISKVFVFFIIIMLLAILPSDTQKQKFDVPVQSSNYGGTLVWGTINPPTIINPALTTHSVSTALLGLLFDSLVRVGPTGHITSGLAESWTLSSDKLVYTFHLRPKVYFHDGVECTAEDIKFTYEAIQNPLNHSPGRPGTEPIKEWKVIDKYTLQLILKYPVPNILSNITREILPQHLYEGSNLMDNPHNYAPIGTGPFRLQSWNRSTNEIVLVANKDYFEGRPFLDKIVIRNYRDNNSLWAALMRQEVDFVKFLNEEDYQILNKDKAFKTYRTNTGMNFVIMYNVHDYIMHDPEVRHAISYAIDRQALMRGLGINGVESNGPFFPESIGFNKDVERVSHNPVRAKLMLAARGWAMSNEGLLKKGETPFVLTMIVNRNRPDYCQMAQILRQQLSEIGIGLKTIFYDFENQITVDYLNQVKPQMWLRMFVSGRNDDPGDMAKGWSSYSGDFARAWFYENKDIDRWFEKGLVLKNSQRAENYQNIHALIDKDHPACFLFFSVLYHAVSSRITNTEDFFHDFMPDYLIKSWFINQERRNDYGNS